MCTSHANVATISLLGSECFWWGRWRWLSGWLDSALFRALLGEGWWGAVQAFFHRGSAVCHRRTVWSTHQWAKRGAWHGSGKPEQLLESHGRHLHETQWVVEGRSPPCGALSLEAVSHCHHPVFIDTCCCFTVGPLPQVSWALAMSPLRWRWLAENSDSVWRLRLLQLKWLFSQTWICSFWVQDVLLKEQVLLIPIDETEIEIS